MLAPGQKPDLGIRLKVLRDGAVKEVTLGELLRRRTIVSVYMKNNTPSCDRQNASLGTHLAEFDRAGYDVVALSRDTCGSHARYAARHGLGHTLASDPEDRFSRALEAVIEKSLYGKKYLGPARAAYVLAADGTLLAVIEKVDTTDHAAQLRAVIKKL